jgi:hypothetical protein
MTPAPDDPAAPAAPGAPELDPDRTLLAREEVSLPTAPARPASSNVLPEGTQLAEFSVTGVIGEGGFGIVYRAHDRALQRTVAVKEYMPSALAARLADTRVVVKSEQHRETFEVGLKSFINEARLLAQFDHPALVKVFRFWAANGTAYMAMPLYEGGTLKHALKQMAPPPDEAWLRKLLVPLLDAIELLHNADCLHRDIAPDNILMGPGSTPETPRPVLLDFGAARRVIGGQTQALTVILKPGYAPIEQYDEIPGMKQGPWTDLYALGAVMHFAITGKPPPPSVGRLVHDAWVPLSTAAAGRYSPGFLAAIDAVLAARPEDRPRNVAQWREMLANGAAAAGSAAASAAAPAASAAAPRSMAAATAPQDTQASAVAPTAPARVDPMSTVRPRWLRAIGIGAAAAGLVIAVAWGVLLWQARVSEQRMATPAQAANVRRPAAHPAKESTAPAPAPSPVASAAEPAPSGSLRSAPQTEPANAPQNAPRPAKVPGTNDGTNGPSAAVAAPSRRSEAPPARSAPTTGVATAPAWIDSALREGRDCLAARQYACTIDRAEAVLKADPGHAVAQALLNEGRAGQEAALGSDWKMR